MSKETLCAGGIGVITTIIGGWDLTIQVLLVLMLVDILTGVFKGIYTCEFSSRAFRKGLVGKAGFFLVLILCYQLDVLMGNGEPVIRTVGTVFYIAIEGTSIIENLGEIGVPVPDIIKKRLSKLKEQIQENVEENIEK